MIPRPGKWIVWAAGFVLLGTIYLCWALSRIESPKWHCPNCGFELPKNLPHTAGDIK
jgi:hypothetical protein